MDELERAINDVVRVLEVQVVIAAEAAGNVIFNEAKIRAKGTIRDSLTIKTFRKRHGARSMIQVERSVKGGDEHHAVFVEYGTSKMPAQPYMRPAYDATAEKAVEVFATTFADGLR